MNKEQILKMTSEELEGEASTDLSSRDACIDCYNLNTVNTARADMTVVTAIAAMIANTARLHLHF